MRAVVASAFPVKDLVLTVFALLEIGLMLSITRGAPACLLLVLVVQTVA